MNQEKKEDNLNKEELKETIAFMQEGLTYLTNQKLINFWNEKIRNYTQLLKNIERKGNEE